MNKKLLEIKLKNKNKFYQLSFDVLVQNPKFNSLYKIFSHNLYLRFSKEKLKLYVKNIFHRLSLG